MTVTWDSHELARLCTLDIGKEVTSEDVRSYLLGNDRALERFDPADVCDIVATILKALAS